MSTRREEEEYVLGQDITDAASAKSRRGTAVLSVRLSVDELSEIDAISRATGRTASQVVREALGGYLHASKYAQPTITVSIEGGGTFTAGSSGLSTRAGQALNLPELAPA
jgi:hypothetical protein